MKIQKTLTEWKGMPKQAHRTICDSSIGYSVVSTSNPAGFNGASIIQSKNEISPVKRASLLERGPFFCLQQWFDRAEKRQNSLTSLECIRRVKPTLAKIGRFTSPRKWFRPNLKVADQPVQDSEECLCSSVMVESVRLKIGRPGVRVSAGALVCSVRVRLLLLVKTHRIRLFSHIHCFNAPISQWFMDSAFQAADRRFKSDLVFFLQ